MRSSVGSVRRRGGTQHALGIVGASAYRPAMDNRFAHTAGPDSDTSVLTIQGGGQVFPIFAGRRLMDEDGARHRAITLLQLLEEYLPCDNDERWEDAQERQALTPGFPELCALLRDPQDQPLPVVWVDESVAWQVAGDESERLVAAYAFVYGGGSELVPVAVK